MIYCHLRSISTVSELIFGAYRNKFESKTLWTVINYVDVIGSLV